MRPFCHRIPSPRRDVPEKKEEKSLTTLPEDPSEISMKSSQDGAPLVSRNSSDVQDDSGSRSETKKKSKSEQIAERHPKKQKRAKGSPGNPPQRQDSFASNGSGKVSLSVPWDTPVRGLNAVISPFRKASHSNTFWAFFHSYVCHSHLCDER